MEKPAAIWSTHSHVAVTAIKNRLIRHCCQIHGKFYMLRHYEGTMKRTSDKRTENNFFIKPRKVCFIVRETKDN